VSSATPLLRVVDFSTHLSGPLASHLLRGLGAEIVKIENVNDGDGNRGMVPFINGTGMFHVGLSGGTRSLAISKHSEHWQTVVEKAVASADAVMVGGRPEDVERLGLDYETLLGYNPRLVYCLISGYGEVGPWRSYPAHGQQPDALAGLLPIDWIDGKPETPPRWRTTCTTLTGSFAALGIMAALRRRDLDERPQYVSVSLWGSAIWWNWRDINTYVGWPDYKDMGSRYALYATADDRVILACPLERKFWQKFCDLLGLPEELKDHGDWDRSRMDFGVGPKYDGEREVIAAAMATKTMDEWSRIFDENEIPFAPVLTWIEALESEHTKENGVMTTTTVDGEEVGVAAPPVALRERPLTAAEHGAPAPVPPAPKLGENTEELLRELGLEELVGAAEDGRIR
jgi:crotonobetainyl-CoA:carnitine CoA-transferase CaiB-like acyl-CoA transferase